MRKAWKLVLVAAAGVALFAAILGGAAAFALSGSGDGPSVRQTTIGRDHVVSFRTDGEAATHGEPGLDCPSKGTTRTQGSADPAQY